MIDVHLIGYTADLEHLVLDLDGGAAGRYRMLVDADLFATLDELREERRAAGLPVGDLSEYLDADELAALEGETTEAEDEPESDPELEPEVAEEEWSEDDASVEDEVDDASADDVAVFSDDDWSEESEEYEEDDAVAQDAEADLLAEVEADRLDAEERRISETVRLVSRPPEPEPIVEDDESSDEVEPEAPEDEPEDEPADEPAEVAAEVEPVAEAEPDPRQAAFADAAQPSRRPSTETGRPKLGPAQIQAMLRSGKSPRAVAREAGTDVTWIERWLPPILAERTRILDRAHAKRLERSRLGPSRDPLGAAVLRNLKAKGLREDDITWDVGRRADGRWKVTVKYEHRGKNRAATWTYDPTDDELRSASETARELGYTRAKRNSAKKKSASSKKKATASKSETTDEATAEKKPAAKKSAAKKSAAKTSAKKPAVKKSSAAKKSGAKKSAAKKPAAAKKSAAKQSAAKKPAAKKSAAKKPAAKKPAAKKPAAEKSAAKKPAAKKPAVKKSATKKAASRTSTAEKGTTPSPNGAQPQQKAKPVAPPPGFGEATSRASADADR